MLSASKIAFTPPLALHSEIRMLMTAVSPSVPLPFSVKRFTCPPMMSSAPSGKTPRKSLRCWLIELGSATKP